MKYRLKMPRTFRIIFPYQKICFILIIWTFNWCFSSSPIETNHNLPSPDIQNDTKDSKLLIVNNSSNNFVSIQDVTENSDQSNYQEIRKTLKEINLETPTNEEEKLITVEENIPDGETFLQGVTTPKVSNITEKVTSPQGISNPEEVTTIPENITTFPEEVTTIPKEVTTIPEEVKTISEESNITDDVITLQSLSNSEESITTEKVTTVEVNTDEVTTVDITTVEVTTEEVTTFQGLSNSEEFNITEAITTEEVTVPKGLSNPEEPNITEERANNNWLAIHKELNDSNDSFHYKNYKEEPFILLRKCCPQKQFYDTNEHNCKSTELDMLKTKIYETFPYLTGMSITTYSKKLPQQCPNSGVQPATETLLQYYSFKVLLTGELHDEELNIVYDATTFCLELVGESLETSNLMAIYCPEPATHIVPVKTQETIEVFPKCCPENQVINTRNLSCFSPAHSDITVSNDQKPQFPNLQFTKELRCVGQFPVEVGLQETFVSNNHFCLANSKSCYSTEDFCIDFISFDSNYQTAFVCPKNFINKCCPDDQNLNEKGCSPTTFMSPTLTHFLINKNYNMKNLRTNSCTPILLEDNPHWGITWFINDEAHAVIIDEEKRFKTSNYCLDDFTEGQSVFPVLKVCSEEVRIHHEINDIETWSQFTDTIGKCCPLNKAYGEVDGTPTCILENDNKGRLDFFSEYQLLYKAIPICTGDELYVKYVLKNSTNNDYGLIKKGGRLDIVEMSTNGCEIKTTEVKIEEFCVDHVFRDDEFVPIAIICIPKPFARGNINLTLVCLSSAALISAIFVLVFMRVRRGMVTMRKVKTLAGKILLSYATSLLFSYIALGVGAVADPQHHVGKCYFIVGFILFFSIAGYCWNTSICIEGLMLTLNVRMKERHRYFLHSLWAWGTPAIITTIALVMDANTQDFECGTITPKLGREMCFFTDTMAVFLYFYLPISMTVLINGMLLVAAKIIRKSKLKNLEKDPNRIKKHESLKQALSIKNIRNRSRKGPPKNPRHSGLRTHQTKNMWIEVLKLVLWSGSTWLTEILGTIYASYRIKTEPDWYGYLLYIPVGFNTLRGVGISFIIVFNSEQKTKLLRSYTMWSSRVATIVSNTIRSRRTTKTSKTSATTPAVVAEEEDRRTSVSTVITDLPESLSYSTTVDTRKSILRPTYVSSVSQYANSYEDLTAREAKSSPEAKSCSFAIEENEDTEV